MRTAVIVEMCAHTATKTMVMMTCMCVVFGAGGSKDHVLLSEKHSSHVSYEVMFTRVPVRSFFVQGSVETPVRYPRTKYNRPDTSPSSLVDHDRLTHVRCRYISSTHSELLRNFRRLIPLSSSCPLFPAITPVRICFDAAGEIVSVCHLVQVAELAEILSCNNVLNTRTVRACLSSTNPTGESDSRTAR